MDVEEFQTEVHDGIYLVNSDLRVRLSNGWVAPWFKMMSLEFVRSHNILFSLDNKFDDVLFHFMAIQAANSIAFCKKSMYYHRVHEGCVTSNALENGDMYFYHFKTVYDALLCGANPSFIKLLLNFVKRYSSNVKSKEKFCAIYAKIVSLFAAGKIDRAIEVAMVGVAHAKQKRWISMGSRVFRLNIWE